MDLKAEVIAVGTELLLGEIVNLDAALISSELSTLGINVYYHHVVGDNFDRLCKVLKTALLHSDIVITTGGLGPTYDDITKNAAAAVTYKKLVKDLHCEERIRGFFHKIGRAMTENNLIQAMIPEGSIVLDNDWGTAPGVIIEHQKKKIIMLPGPPRECEMMLKHKVMPYLENLTGKTIVSRTIHLIGIGESVVDEELSDLMKNSVNPSAAPYAKDGELTVRLSACASDKQKGLEMIEPLLEEIKNRLGGYIYGIDISNIETAVYQGLKKEGLTLGCAESCTGGLISKRITDIPGSSEIFKGGICSYSNSMKIDVLGVREETIEKHGAVSQKTALEMARGAVKICGSDIGIASTGIAGPGGGENPDNPVGTVYIALCCGDYEICRKFNFWGERHKIRNNATSFAFDMIRKYLEQRA